MPKFKIKWEIDIEAEDPKSAAHEAFAIMQRPGSTASVFEVQDETGKLHTVDLNPEEEGK